MTASQLETGYIILIEKHNFNRKEENNFIFHVCMKEKQPWTSCVFAYLQHDKDPHQDFKSEFQLLFMNVGNLP